jgi:hypothetical protein
MRLGRTFHSLSNFLIQGVPLSGTDPQIDKAIDNAQTKAQFQVVALDQTFESK